MGDRRAWKARPRLLVLSMLVAVSFGVPTASAQAEAAEAAEPAAATPAESGRIEEIVVRARRRDEFIQDTPVSVTALSEAALQRNGVTRLDDIQEMVPNLTFYSGRGGQTSAVFIRGVGQVDPVITFDPGVGIYVDGVFMSRQAGGVLNMVDVEQVEVLRGPQGTLFGKNTVGGAILVKSTQPTEEFSGEVRFGAGSFDTFRTRVTLNAPVELGSLGDRLFTRFTFAQESSQGYTKNTFLDQYSNDVNSLGFLGSLRFLATDDIEVNVTGNWFRDQTHGKGGRCVVATDPPPLGGLVNPQLPDECRRSRKFRFEANTAALSDIETYGLWGNVVKEFGAVGFLDDLSARWISSWREQRPRIREDGDGTRLLELQLSDVGGSGDFDGGPGFQRQFSQELKFDAAAWDDRISVVAGAFGFWEKATSFMSIRSLPTVSEQLPALGATTDSRTAIDNYSWALFTQATVDPLEWLSFTGGGRYTQEKKGFARLRTVPPALDPDGKIPPLVDEPGARKIFDAWTFMANATVRAPEDSLADYGVDSLLAYFTFSQGFKSGGFNGNVLNGDAGDPGARGLDSFSPETLDSFELGLKLVALDRRLSFSGSIFRSNYDDIQVAVIDKGASVLAEIFVENAAAATIEGAEIEVDVRPLDGLTLAGSVAFLDTRYDSFEGAPSAAEDKRIDRTGESFPNVPDFESRLAISYSFDTPDLDWPFFEGTITPILQHSYRSKVHYQGPELVEATQPGYHLLHARIGYVFNDDRSEISFWGRNLTDTAYFQQNFPTANTLGVVVQYFETPRTFGVEISQRF